MMNAGDSASPETRAMAALLARTDTGVFRLHLGEGAAELAASLGNGHCFEVLHVFALPRAPEGIADSVAAFVVESGGARLGNGWFSGVALDALAAFLVRACVAGGGGLLHQGSAPDQTRCDDTSRCANTAGSRPDSSVGSIAPPPNTPAAGGTERGSDSGDEEQLPEEEEEDGVGGDIWQHVEGCPAADADKAVDIRAALEQRLGKPAARHLLACTRATVAKQNGGRKNRILRLGGTALKLRSA